MKLVYKNIFVFIIFLVLGAILSIEHQQGTSWDLLNYHLYIPWSFFNDRVSIDLAPCGIHSYFNPIGMIPYYLMVKYLNDFPIVVAILQGWVWSILGFLVYLIARKLIRTEKENLNIFLSFISSLIGITATVVYMQIGMGTIGLSSFIPILIALYLLLKNEFSKKILFLVGVFIGVGFGLKFTNGIYVIGTLATVFSSLIFNQKLKLKDVFVKSLFYCIGALFGFLLIDGYWMFLLYSEFKNPVFPLFNNVFKSDLYPQIGYHDDRYVIKNVLDLLVLPVKNLYQIIWNQEQYEKYIEDVVTHYSIYDARLGLAYISSILMLLISKISKVNIKYICLEKAIILVYFFLFSYFIWAYQFKIVRYFAGSLILSGLIIVILFIVIAEFSKRYKVCIASFLAITLFIFFSMHIPNLGVANIPFYYQRMHFGSKVLDVPNLNFKDDSVVVFAGKPMSYIALNQNKNVKYIGFYIWADGKENLVPTDKYYEKAYEIMNNASKVYLIYSTHMPEDIVQNINEKLKSELKLKGNCSELKPNVINQFNHTEDVFNITFCE